MTNEPAPAVATATRSESVLSHATIHAKHSEDEARPLLSRGVSTVSILGTLGLTNSDTVYVPRATADPRDPLNMRAWQKNVIVVLICSFSAISLSFIGGFGGIISFYLPDYLAQGNSYASVTHLMTYPTLLMGIGNLVGMPIAIAVGRRSVMLAATVVLIIGASLCAVSTTLGMHMAARMLIGLAAGQSESVVPLIVQEIHFLHERTRTLMIQQSVQVVISAIWMLCASPIAQRLSPSWWYGLGAMVTSVQLLFSIFFLPETKYARGIDSVRGADIETIETCTKRPSLDFVNFKPRTWAFDMQLWHHTPDWNHGVEVLVRIKTLLVQPNVLWVAVLSGVSLGINIAMATTYSNVLTNPPYNWPDRSISYANIGQIPIALICFPLLGQASDLLSQKRARTNGGIHEARSRLFLLIIPISISLASAVWYGHGASNPLHYHWILYPLTLAGYFFGFVGTNIICITYLLDTYPEEAGSVLIFVCSCRGILSWLISFNIAYSIDWVGYFVTFAALGSIIAVLGVLLLPVFLTRSTMKI